MPTPGQVRAGGVFVELLLKDSKFYQGLRAAEAGLTNFGKKLQSAGKSMMAAAGGAGGGLLLGAKFAADFEKQMQNVSTMLDEPGKHIPGFRAGISGMAVEFGESTETLAKGLYDLLSASVAPEKAMAVLRETMKAAKGGMTDTAVSTQAVVNVLNAYHIPAERASEVTDMLFRTVKRGVVTFPELAEGIGTVTATGYAAGLSMDELGAAIATMTRSGLKSDIAVTALQNVLAEFLKPSEEGAALARSFGVEMNTATLRSRGLLGVLRQLAAASPETLAKIFPDVRGLRGLLALRGDLEGFAADVEGMKTKAGAADEAYKKMTGGLWGYWGKLKQAGVQAMVAIGDAIGPSLKEYGAAVLRLVPPLIQWIKLHGDAIRTYGKWVLILGVAGGALWTLGAGLKVLGFGLGFVATAIKLLLANPITGLLTAVAAIVAFMVPWGKVIGSVTAKIKGLMPDLSGMGAAAHKTAEEVNAAQGAIEGKINRLAELRSKQSLSNDEMREAATLAADLKSAYPELAAHVNRLGTSYEATATAMKAFHAAMARERIAAYEADLLSLEKRAAEIPRKIAEATVAASRPAEVAHQIKTLKAELAQAGLFYRDFIRGRLKTLEEEQKRLAARGGGEEAALRKERDNINAQIAARKDLIAQLKEIEAQAAKAPGTAALAKPKDMHFIEDMNRRYREAVRQQKLLAIAQRENREVESVRLQFSEEEARRAGAPADVAAMEQAKAAEIAAVQERFRRERIEAERDMAEEIAKAEIELREEGAARSLALLELERSKALEKARLEGLSVDKVNQLFDLKRKIIEQDNKAEKAKTDVVGAFDAALLRMTVSPAPALAAAAAGAGGQVYAIRTANNTQRMLVTLGQMRDILRAHYGGRPRWHP